MTIATGTRLGRYEIRSLLGAGGMGEVCLAKDTQFDRRVAITIQPPYAISDEHARKRLVIDGDEFSRNSFFLEDPQISRDGHQLLYSRGRITGDIWIMNLGMVNGRSE